MECVTFTLGGESYALESRYIYEVFRLTSFSRLPSRNPLAFGVTVWRGTLLTILDVRSALGLSASALNDLSRVIVVGTGHPEFGILADRVHELMTVDPATLDPASGRAYVSGLTPDAVLVLDAAHLITLHA